VNAKAAFTRTADSVFDSLTTGLEMPKVKGKIVSDRFELKDYCLSVHRDAPALFCYFTLHSICATEALLAHWLSNLSFGCADDQGPSINVAHTESTLEGMQRAQRALPQNDSSAQRMKCERAKMQHVETFM
jgi:hypothetical protein